MDVLPLLLAETRTSNPSYPVNRVYKRLGLLNKSANDDLSTGIAYLRLFFPFSIRQL